jgi:hypothetical protein
VNQLRAHAIATLTATLLPGAALAQDGHGKVTFEVHVTGSHNVPTAEGGHRNVEKNRTFRGTAHLKYVGRSFAPPPMKGYDKASFERDKDACEQKSSDEQDIAACQDEVQERQNAAERAAVRHINPANVALHTPRTDVWANESCSGELEVADKGTYRGITVAEGDTRMRELAYSLTANQQVKKNSPGSDGCSFSLVYDPTTQTAEINIDAGPLRVGAVERVGEGSTRTNISPFDWTAIRKFEKSNLKVAGTRNGHSGAWNESTGEPIALAGASRAKGEVVRTSTRITWHFTGQPLPPKPQVLDVQQDARDNAPVQGVPGRDDDPMAGCLEEQKKTGREQPDAVELLQCVEKKGRSAQGVR